MWSLKLAKLNIYIVNKYILNLKNMSIWFVFRLFAWKILFVACLNAFEVFTFLASRWKHCGYDRRLIWLRVNAKKKNIPFYPLGFVLSLPTVSTKQLGSIFPLGQCNMRSLVGLICVIVAATFYLYSLSLYLPAGPRRHVPGADRGEHVDTGQPEQPADSSGEPIR